MGNHISRVKQAVKMYAGVSDGCSTGFVNWKICFQSPESQNCRKLNIIYKEIAALKEQCSCAVIQLTDINKR